MNAPSERSNNAGFEEFYRSNFAKVATISGNRLGSRHDGSDVAQEVLLRAWIHDIPTNYREPAAWLRRVAINYSTDLIRRRNARPLEVSFNPDTNTVPISSPQDVVVDSETLKGALSMINPDQSDALIEVYIHGRTRKEAADVLGIPIGTVRSRVHYGLNAMRRVLNGSGSNE